MVSSLSVNESLPVSVSLLAPTSEAAKEVDALRVLAAVVHVWLRALVQVGHAGDRVQRAVHVQIAVANVAPAGL